MGTNYYWNPQITQQIYGVDNIDLDDPRVHIGKQSAMTGYCKECGITRAGHSGYVHVDRKKNDGASFSFIAKETCPNCDAPWDSTLTSFTFTMMGHLVTISNLYNIEYAVSQRDPLTRPLDVIIDEYERPFTAMHFLDDILRKCPVQFQDYGRWS